MAEPWALRGYRFFCLCAGDVFRRGGAGSHFQKGAGHCGGFCGLFRLRRRQNDSGNWDRLALGTIWMGCRIVGADGLHRNGNHPSAFSLERATKRVTKLQDSNTKHQRNSKQQTSNPNKIPNRQFQLSVFRSNLGICCWEIFWTLEFGASLVLGVWCLDLPKASYQTSTGPLGTGICSRRTTAGSCINEATIGGGAKRGFNSPFSSTNC